MNNMIAFQHTAMDMNLEDIEQIFLILFKSNKLDSRHKIQDISVSPKQYLGILKSPFYASNPSHLVFGDYQIFVHCVSEEENE